MKSILTVYYTAALSIKTDITGNWLSENSNMVEIYFKDGKYHGVVNHSGPVGKKELETGLKNMMLNRVEGVFTGTYLENNKKWKCTVKKISGSVLRISIQNKKNIYWHRLQVEKM